MTTIVAGNLASGAVLAVAERFAPSNLSLVVEELHIPAADPGIGLFLRCKRLREMKTSRSEHTRPYSSDVNPIDKPSPN